MKHHPTGLPAAAALLALLANPALAATVTFETVNVSPDGYWNGSDLSGTLSPISDFGESTYNQNRQIEGSGFQNSFTDWGGGSSSWSGFAISNHTDTTTPGFANQYSAFAGSGAGGSAQYAIGYYSTYSPVMNVQLSALTELAGKGASFTNSTWAALDMMTGASSKKFGGVSGNDPDWFKLTIEGFATGISTGTVDFYLADFRFADNSQDYIVDDWRYVDFSPLGSVDELRFSMSSTDNNAFGILTPTYFAMDNFLAVPEPSSIMAALASLGLLARRKRQVRES